jgi:hypothetical protein
MGLPGKSVKDRQRGPSPEGSVFSCGPDQAGIRKTVSPEVALTPSTPGFRSSNMTFEKSPCFRHPKKGYDSFNAI